MPVAYGVLGDGGLGAGMLELHLAYRTGKGFGHLGEVARRPGQGPGPRAPMTAVTPRRVCSPGACADPAVVWCAASASA